MVCRSTERDSWRRAAGSGEGCESGMRGEPVGSAGAGELGEVVGGANQRPFASHLVETAEEDLSEASGLFDLTGHWLDDLLAQSVTAAMTGAFELAAHPFHQRAAALSLADCGLGAVPLPSDGNVAGDATADDRAKIGVRTVAGVGRDLGRVVPQMGLDRIEQRGELRLVGGGIGEGMRDDDLLPTVDRSLRIIALTKPLLLGTTRLSGSVQARSVEPRLEHVSFESI